MTGNYFIILKNNKFYLFIFLILYNFFNIIVDNDNNDTQWSFNTIKDSNNNNTIEGSNNNNTIKDSNNNNTQQSSGENIIEVDDNNNIRQSSGENIIENNDTQQSSGKNY